MLVDARFQDGRPVGRSDSEARRLPLGELWCRNAGYPPGNASQTTLGINRGPSRQGTRATTEKQHTVCLTMEKVSKPSTVARRWPPAVPRHASWNPPLCSDDVVFDKGSYMKRR
jgi:hypothetical protein